MSGALGKLAGLGEVPLVLSLRGGGRDTAINPNWQKLGRYYATSAFTLAVSIIAKKEVLLDQPGREGRCQVGSGGLFFPKTKDGCWLSWV